MREEFWYDSLGKGKLHGCRWSPQGAPRAVVQIIHGIAEYIERYDDFASFLNQAGILVVGEDHMGHGQSIRGGSIQGYFHGGWFTAVEDSYRLMQTTMAEHPGVPYILFGHSMGSFMARTILCVHPDCGLAGAILCGTGWQPRALLAAVIPAIDAMLAHGDETAPNPKLQALVFGSYNRRVEHPKTSYDWINRDSRAVQEYLAHPLCGFTPSSGLMRSMLEGIQFIQEKRNLSAMSRELPVLFIAGGDDPVGSYGKGVRRTAEEFRKAGMQDVKLRIYPLCRHEILNEINKREVYEDVLAWINGVLVRK